MREKPNIIELNHWTIIGNKQILMYVCIDTL